MGVYQKNSKIYPAVSKACLAQLIHILLVHAEPVDFSRDLSR